MFEFEINECLRMLSLTEDLLNDTGNEYSEELDEAIWHVKQATSYLESYKRINKNDK